MILGFVGLRDLATTGDTFNALGKLLIFLAGIDTIFMNIATILCMKFWTNASFSALALRLGWLASFLLPLLPAMFPLEALLKDEVINALGEELEDPDSFLLVLKLTLALSYAIQLLPVVITCPGGAVRGARRVLRLLPGSSLPGWIITVAAPFYSLLVCVALVIVIQVAGNGILFLGTVFLVVAPLVYLFRGQLFTKREMAGEDINEYQLKMTQKTSAAITAVGMLFLLVWAFIAESNGVRVVGHRKNEETDSFLTYGKGIRLICEMIGRLLVTTVLFSDIVLTMTIYHWRESSGKKDENRDADLLHFDRIMGGNQEDEESLPQTAADSDEENPSVTPEIVEDKANISLRDGMSA